MSIYIILHILLMITFIPLGILVYKKYKTSSGIFFLMFTIYISIWLFLYTLVFSTNLAPNNILFLNKIMYGLSMNFLFFMLSFIYYFRLNKKDYIKQYISIFGILTFLFIGTVFSSFILESVEYIAERGRYIETFGPLYLIYALMYVSYIPLLIGISIWKINSLKSINKFRLLYVVIGYLIFVSSAIIFLVILPLFGMNILDNNIVFLAIPFFLCTLYAIRGFKFININILLGKVIIFLISLISSIFITTLIKNYYVQLGVWGVNENYNLGDMIVGVILFYILYNTISLFFYTHTYSNKFLHNINIIKKQIGYTKGLDDLNFLLQKLFRSQLSIHFIEIELFNTSKKHQELSSFFDNTIKYNYFLNDTVFIEENKHKLISINEINHINKKVFLILPLHNNKQKIVGFLNIGRKKFKDYYYSDEINILQELATAIENHIKYIDTYKKVHELSVNLDKQVDKQTFEYNQLINKQKEFISIISHEVKGPIASSIFQMDTIIEDYEDGNLTGKELSKELHVLNNLLLKTGDLVNKLFSIQQFEMNTKSLFLEQIKLPELISNETKIFGKLEPNIKFITEIDESIGYISLDKVQFRQVIDNLIGNAVKVIDKKTGQIYVSCKLIEQETIEIVIEDNGKGFTDIEIKKIFEKYTTGGNSGIGLGMGLYLCKNIVEMHGGNIQADFGKKLGGARIIIKIPKT